jgi:hypothetical protein
MRNMGFLLGAARLSLPFEESPMLDLSRIVEPDRVRREAYTDPRIFDLEMQRIHETVWIYCGHESQVPRRATTTRCRSAASR